MVLFPIFGALALAGSTLLEKIILRKRKISTKVFTSATFLAVVLIMLPLIFFFWKVEPEALSLANISLLVLVIIFSLIANILIFYSIKGDKISSLEPARMLEPLFVILLALAFSFEFSKLFERNFHVLIPAFIAALALVFSHIKKHHLSCNKYFLASIFGSLFFALELICSVFILDFYNPFSFYFLRCVGVAIIAVVFFKPQFKELNKKMDFTILGIAALWVVYRVIVYYGYMQLGVVFTTLLVMLSPIFIYILAIIFLKEKPSWRNIISAIIILGCVVYAILP